VSGLLHTEMQAALAADREARSGVPGTALAAQRAAGLASAAFWCADPQDDVRIEDVGFAGAAGPLRARLYRPHGDTGNDPPVVALVHGGAFVVGSIEQAEPVARQLAAEGPARVVSLGYRLAPEHPFPAALDDVAAGLAWAAGQADGGAIALVGISAGANLVASLLAAGRATANCVVHVYGWFDTVTETASRLRFGDGAYGLGTQRLGAVLEQYLPAGIDRADPRVAPLRADLSGMPPSLLVAAECDPLADDSRLMQAALRRAGREATLSVYSGMAHGFINKGRMVEAARTAVRQMARFLATHNVSPSAAPTGVPTEKENLP
jgi:acetyl esterase